MFLLKFPMKTWEKLVEEFEAKFFDDGIGEDVFGDALDLSLGFFAGQAVKRENEKFSLADTLNFREAERGKGAVNGLALGIKDSGFEHDPDVCFHQQNYTSPADFAAARKLSR
jgi:hypothetical protein